MDIAFATTSLSRFSAGPRKGHLKLARKTLGCLKKFPKKGIVMNPAPPIVNKTQDETFEDFRHHHHDFKETLDLTFPEPLI